MIDPGEVDTPGPLDEHPSRRRPVALVVGARHGIGLATSRTLASTGHRVMLADQSTDISRARDTLAAEGADVGAVIVDVRDRASVSAAVEATTSHYGALDVVVNCAAAPRQAGPVLDIDERRWDETFAVNVRGGLTLIQVAAKEMLRDGVRGSIVCVASNAGLRPVEGRADYAVSKAAVIALTRAAALELAPFGVRVNCVAPGPTATENARAVELAMTPDERAAAEALKASIPFGVADAEAIGDAIAFLASPSAAHITGQTLLVDGGLLLR